MRRQADHFFNRTVLQSAHAAKASLIQSLGNLEATVHSGGDASAGSASATAHSSLQVLLVLLASAGLIVLATYVFTQLGSFDAAAEADDLPTAEPNRERLDTAPTVFLPGPPPAPPKDRADVPSLEPTSPLPSDGVLQHTTTNVSRTSETRSWLLQDDKASPSRASKSTAWWLEGEQVPSGMTDGTAIFAMQTRDSEARSSDARRAG